MATPMRKSNSVSFIHHIYHTLQGEIQYMVENRVIYGAQVSLSRSHQESPVQRRNKVRREFAKKSKKYSRRNLKEGTAKS
jgi:hypothetical protein